MKNAFLVEEGHSCKDVVDDSANAVNSKASIGFLIFVVLVKIGVHKLEN